MNSTLQKFLLSLAYGVAGVFLTLVIPFLHSDPTVIGTFTPGLIVICTSLQEYFFPTQTVASAQLQIAAASGKPPVPSAPKQA